MMIDDIVTEMLPMFLEDGREKLVRMAELIDLLPAVNGASAERLELMRLIHSLKGTAGTFGFHSLAVICHRLEDYLQVVNHGSPRVVQDISIFIARMEAIIERGVEPGEQQSLAVYQSLPLPPLFDAVTTQPLSALFIGPRDVQLRMIEGAVRACGIRLSCAPSSFQGIELAVRTRPDFVMVANIIDLLDGTEVVWMLRTTRRLKALPLLLLVADVGDEPAKRRLQQGLPADVMVVRKYPRFPQDFADALTRLKIL